MKTLSMASFLLLSSWLKKIRLSTLFLLLFLPARFNANDSSVSKIVRTDDGRAENLQWVFVEDIKKLLTHNQIFYNTYGFQDVHVNLAFEEAKFAADVIHLYPNIFQARIQNINRQINDVLIRRARENSVTADGVPIYFVDNCLLILGAMGGIVRFPE